MHLVGYNLFSSFNKHQPSSILKLTSLSYMRIAYIVFVYNMKFHGEELPRLDIYLQDEIPMYDLKLCSFLRGFAAWYQDLLAFNYVDVPLHIVIEVLLKLLITRTIFNWCWLIPFCIMMKWTDSPSTYTWDHTVGLYWEGFLRIITYIVFH